MHCPICETEFQGTRCPCGWAPGSAQGPAQPTKGRPWKFCEWQTAHGTCEAPTGTVAKGLEHGPWGPPRLCAWHRERERMSLADWQMTERQVFDAWLTRFPAGAPSPLPGIWDQDPELLWLLITGAVSFAEVQAHLRRRIVATEGEGSMERRTS